MFVDMSFCVCMCFGLFLSVSSVLAYKHSSINFCVIAMLCVLTYSSMPSHFELCPVDMFLKGHNIVLNGYCAAGMVTFSILYCRKENQEIVESQESVESQERNV